MAPNGSTTDPPKLEDACAAAIGEKKATAGRQIESIKTKRATRSVCVEKELTANTKKSGLRGDSRHDFLACFDRLTYLGPGSEKLEIRGHSFRRQEYPSEYRLV